MIRRRRVRPRGGLRGAHRRVAGLGFLAALLVATTAYAQAEPAPPGPPPPAAPEAGPDQPGEMPPPRGRIDLATPPPPAPSRAGRKHDGFYLRSSLGAGGIASETTFTPDLVEKLTIEGGGIAFELMLGGTIGHFVLGGGIWTASSPKPSVNWGGVEGEGDFNLGLTMVGPFLDWYPAKRDGFHLGVGLGATLLSVDDNGENASANEPQSSRGGGFVAFIGYDFWVGPEWSLGVQGRYLGAELSGSEGNLDHETTAQSFALMVTALFH